MKTFSLLVASLLCACGCFAQPAAVHRRAAAAHDNAGRDDVAYVKAIDVKTLDPSLPSQSLEGWLKSGPPHTDALSWMPDETCDLMPEGYTDYPRCVRVEFRRGGQSGYLLVLIGTLRKGIIGPPRLYEGIGVQQDPFVQTGWAERLSGLPGLLNQPAVTGSVIDLYQRIVERHPIGIPTGAARAAIWPFLSRRLARQLETTQACQDDYFRQHPDPGAGPKPAWLDSGIFVGHSKRAFPLNALVTHQEPQKDGSFAISVSLTYVKLPGFVPDEATWEAVARVIPQDNRFDIDDVRLFDGLGTDGPSHLLSETFAGCDGAHWTGEHVVNKPPAPLPLPHYTDWDAVNALRGTAYDEEVTFAKAVDVHKLDPSLPSQRLEDWLKSASMHANHIEWHGLKCNIKEGGYGKEGQWLVSYDPDGRLCAGVWFQRGNARATINVSSHPKGASGAPQVDFIGVQDKDDSLLTPLPADGNFEKAPDSRWLSDLPRLLDEEAVIDATRNLYDAVVTHHPLGIPQGPDKLRIGPLLSTRMRRQLETAQACQADYLRQNSHPTETTKPAWLTAGLFSGDGALASPGADLVAQKERQGDGSFQVLVWLSRENSAPPASPPLSSSWRAWHVSALVKPEEGRFVVDEIRLFSDNFTDSPSRLLSESFTGCDGPRWVGIGTATK